MPGTINLVKSPQLGKLKTLAKNAKVTHKGTYGLLLDSKQKITLLNGHVVELSSEFVYICKLMMLLTLVRDASKRFLTN